MDKKTFEERVQKLREIDTVVKSLDPAIREASFRLLEPYVTGRTTIKPPPAQGERKEEPPSEGEIDRETFFTKFECKKPSDNVFLIAAYDYSQFGTAGISSNEVRKLADEVGITVPRRPDATLAQAKRNGKSLFDRTGSGRYKPTVYGEKFFRETYEVSKGTKKKPDVEA